MPERIINTTRSAFFSVGFSCYIVASGGGNYLLDFLILGDRPPHTFRIFPAVGAVPCSDRLNSGIKVPRMRSL